MLAGGLLVLAAGVIVYFIRDDRGELARFKRLGGSTDRQRRYRIWIAKAFLAFVPLPLIGLALLGRARDLAVLPPEFASLRALLPFDDNDLPVILGTMAGGLIGGGMIAALISRFRKGAKPVMLGDVEAILPRNRAELALGALLSVNAGVSEELFFRLFLPLLIVLLGANASVAVIIAVAMFGIVHLYQGPVGIIATALLGVVLTVVYIGTGSLLAAIAAHVLIDLNALVLRPALMGAWRAAD